MKRSKKREERLLLIFCFGFLLFLASTAIASAQTEQNHYNVLLITIDTLRPDRLSCYSTEYLNTPNIDALADRGALFERAFAHNSITLPSHVNILLGTTPLYHGVHDNAQFRVSEEAVTLAEYLKSKGYSTGAFIGAFSLDSRFGLNQGFDVYDESYPAKSSVTFVPPERTADEVVAPALDWLEDQTSNWLCWIHLWDPHALYQPPEPFATQFGSDPYSGEVAYVDAQLKKVFDFLSQDYLADNTVVILTGDHGESLGEHGELTHTYFAYNSTIWIPLIITGPGISKARFTENVCHIDIFPTICDILNIEKPASLQGESLVPLMNGRKMEPRLIYFESLGSYYTQGWAPQWGFIQGQNKYFDSPIPELYDLETDFGETKNIAENADLGVYQKQLDELKQKLSSPMAQQALQRIDRQTQEKLRSLGYVASPSTTRKESYAPDDDLKTLLPFQKKLDDAINLGDEGKNAESEKLLYEIIEERKDFVQAYLYLYQILAQDAKMEDVIKLLEMGMMNNPQSYAIISTFGVVLVREGQFDRGIDVLQKAIAILDFDPDAWHYMGFAYWQKKDNARALELYRKALSLDDSDPMLYYNIGMLYLSISMESKSTQDFQRAMDAFKTSIARDESFALAYRGLGMGYRMLGRPIDAITVWEQSIQLNPQDEFVLINLANAYFEVGNRLQAIKYFEAYLSQMGTRISVEEKSRIDGILAELKK